jgi:hypothetical protein
MQMLGLCKVSTYNAMVVRFQDEQRKCEAQETRACNAERKCADLQKELDAANEKLAKNKTVKKETK